MNHKFTQSFSDRELSLREMLADPIVRMVMARDGVTKKDVECVVGAARDRMAGRQMESRGMTTRRQAPSHLLDERDSSGCPSLK